MTEDEIKGLGAEVKRAIISWLGADLSEWDRLADHQSDWWQCLSKLSETEVDGLVAAVLVPISALTADRERLREAWLPIQSAPKDGTRVLLAEVRPEYTNIMEGRWCTVYGPRTLMDYDETDPPQRPNWWGLTWRLGSSDWPSVKKAARKELSPYGSAELSTMCNATHWRPLPDAPSLSALSVSGGLKSKDNSARASLSAGAEDTVANPAGEPTTAEVTVSKGAPR